VSVLQVLSALLSAARSEGSSGASQGFWARINVLASIIMSSKNTGRLTVTKGIPEAGVSYYDVPPEYGVRDYRYTVVNDRPVLVDPRSRRVVEFVE
jgi:Protein of unknown function (DUF1236)